MTPEYSGRGSPQKTLSLLWGLNDGVRPGRKPSLTPAEVGIAAIELADASGLRDLSMRVLAQRLGVATMSLYRYVPGKPELVDLMIELAHSELPYELAAQEWPMRVRQVATDSWALYLRHPWMLEISTYRASLGPHSLRKYERELGAVAGAGLPDLDMDLLVATVSDFVRGAARSAIEARAARVQTGQTDQEWWDVHAGLLQQLVDPAVFPLAVRIGAAAGAEYGGTTPPDRAFQFGLERLVEGMRQYVHQVHEAQERRRSGR